MARDWFLNETWDNIDLGLTVEDVMRDLDPYWSTWSPQSHAAAADVAALLAVLA